VAEKIERPKLPSPVNVGGGGQIVVKVSGKLRQISTDPKIKVVRID